MGAKSEPKATRKGREHRSRNRELIAGVNALGRSASKKHRAIYRHKEKKTPAAAKPEHKEKKEPRWYQVDQVPRPVHSRKHNHRQTRLRSSVTPGTILILLAGKQKGKRVIFLKQLESGLLLITGPFGVNGVPLRRVNQAYAIATSTKIDISTVDVKGLTDDLFAKAAPEEKKQPGGDSFIAEPKEKKRVISPERKEAQKRVDDALKPLISKVEHLESYLHARFSLKRNTLAHAIKF